MKTLVIGLGNIGTIYGWALCCAGIDVTHVVRRGQGKMFEGGIELDVLDLRKGYPETQQTVYHPTVMEEVSPADGYELVILPTKGDQLADAVRQYRDLAPHATFLLFGANWEGPGEIDALLPRSRYLWGLAAANGSRVGDVLFVNMRDDYRIGKFEGISREKLQAVIELFGKAGLKADSKENIIEWLWIHYAINGGLVGTALYAGGIKELVNDPALMIFMVYAVRDALKVLEKRGVDVNSYEDTKPYLQERIDEFTGNYADSVANTNYGQRVIKSGHFNSNPDEMRQFYLDVLKSGEQLGVYIPHLRAIRSRIESPRI